MPSGQRIIHQRTISAMLNVLPEACRTSRRRVDGLGPRVGSGPASTKCYDAARSARSGPGRGWDTFSAFGTTCASVTSGLRSAGGIDANRNREAANMSVTMHTPPITISISFTLRISARILGLVSAFIARTPCLDGFLATPEPRTRAMQESGGRSELVLEIRSRASVWPELCDGERLRQIVDRGSEEAYRRTFRTLLEIIPSLALCAPHAHASTHESLVRSNEPFARRL
jgi:hypothetical protein